MSKNVLCQGGITPWLAPMRSLLLPILLATGCGNLDAKEVVVDSTAQAMHDDDSCSSPLVPPDQSYRGKTYAEWATTWWQTFFSIPIDDYPDGCAAHPQTAGGIFPDQGRVRFLSGIGGGATIPVTIKAGTALFFPVINVECSTIEPPPFHGDNEAELRACADGFIDRTTGRFATIDGVPVENLDAFRVESPSSQLFTFGPLPEHNALQCNQVVAALGGTTAESVDSGVYLLLKPLSVGSHTVHFGGTFTDVSFTVDTTYEITVTPRCHHHDDND